MQLFFYYFDLSCFAALPWFGELSVGVVIMICFMSHNNTFAT